MRFTTLTTFIAVLLTLLASRGEAWAQHTALVIPVRGEGAETSALEAATRSVQRRLQARGYSVVLLDEGIPSAGVSPGDLGELGRARGARIIVDTALVDFAGMTSVQVRIVSAEGVVLGEDADLARADTLPQDTAVVLANALQAVPRADRPAVTSGLDSPFGGPATTPAPDSPFEGPETTPDPQGGGQPPAVTPAPRPRRRPPPRHRRRPDFPERHVWLGAVVEPAMGTNRSSFNLTTGARGEFQWRGLTLGLDLHYTFIKDWEPRSNPSYHTMSVFAMAGYQIRLGSDRLTLPILVGGGYIPGNGGLLRFEVGLSIRPIDRMQIRLIFVCPNFWFVDDEMILFTSVSLAVLFGF